MAVEIRCPDCRAKLRLAEAPAAGEEVECPKCGNLFEAAGDEAPARATKKKRPADEDENAPKPKKPAAESKPKTGDKKRKPRKKKTNKSVLIGACIGGIVAVAMMVGVLFYLLGRQPPAIALMGHVPGDATYAYGINFSQIQKYAKFYKDFESLFAPNGGAPFSGFDPITKALGKPFNDLIDYSIGAGSGKWDSGDILILKTKGEFDPAKLSSMGGTTETIDNVTVYTVQQSARSTGNNTYTGGFSAKIFAPTNRVIVMAPLNTPSSRLQQMTRANLGEGSFISKMGSLGKRAARGNVWWFTLDEYRINTTLVRERNKVKGDDPFLLYAAVPAQGGTPSGLTVGTIQGFGIRANLRSKSVSFEVAFWEQSSTEASEVAKKFNQSELAKGDEGQLPATFSDFGVKYFGEKLLVAQILSNLNFRSSGDLFLAQSEAQVEKIQIKMQEWASNLRSNGKPGGN